MTENLSEIKNSGFRFLNFVVKESHIILNEQGEFNININFAPKGYIFSSLNQFHLELAVEITEASNKLNIKLITISVFEFEPGSDIDQYKSSFFTINAPAIVFPYIRAYISNLTTQSGLLAITLPTLNLSALGENLKANIQEMN
jgi:preprotein translocase subunit SecB